MLNVYGFADIHAYSEKIKERGIKNSINFIFLTEKITFFLKRSLGERETEFMGVEGLGKKRVKNKD